MIISKDLVYDLIEEKPSKVVLDIISDIGGIMGLCIGASLMSFVELIDLALNVSKLTELTGRDKPTVRYCSFLTLAQDV